MSEDTNPLRSGKFKNLGIDHSFIEKEAHKYNDKVEKHYHGGTRNDEPVKREPAPTHIPKQTQEPKEEQNTGEHRKMEIDYPQLKQEMSAMMDEKVNALAQLMQKYANQTDARLDKIEAMLSQVRETKGADRPIQDTLAEQQQATQTRQQTAHGNGEATGRGNGNNMDPKLAIENVFDFSGNKDGKIKKQ